MIAALVALVIVIVIIAVAMVVLIISRIVAEQRGYPTGPPSAGGPEYTHRPETVKYYGQTEAAQGDEPKTDQKPADKDPRHAPLPRCPVCGSATAYGDEKCSKCGQSLRPS